MRARITLLLFAVMLAPHQPLYAASKQAFPGASGRPFQALTQYITDLQTEMNTFTQQLMELQLTAQQLQAQIASSVTDVSTLQSQLSTVQAQIVMVQTQINFLQDALNTKQGAITGSCPSGSSIRQINPDGSVICQEDSSSGSGAGQFVTKISPVQTASFGQSVSYAMSCPSGYILSNVGYSSSAYVTINQAAYPSLATGFVVGSHSNAAFSDRQGFFQLYLRCQAASPTGPSGF